MLVVTFSLKYRDYQREIRWAQLERASKFVQKNSPNIGKCHANDFKRFIAKKSITSDGEIAAKNVYRIDSDLIAKEALSAP